MLSLFFLENIVPVQITILQIETFKVSSKQKAIEVRQFLCTKISAVLVLLLLASSAEESGNKVLTFFDYSSLSF